MITPFGYTKYQLTKFIPERLSNPPLLKLLYISWVITDPKESPKPHDTNKGTEEGGDRDDDTDQGSECGDDEQNQKNCRLCKEISRRSGGLVIYAAGIQDIQGAYKALCHTMGIKVHDKAHATPRQLMEYLSSTTLMNLSRATKDLPDMITEAPCRHIVEVQPFETQAFAGYVSKPGFGKY